VVFFGSDDMGENMSVDFGHSDLHGDGFWVEAVGVMKPSLLIFGSCEGLEYGSFEGGEGMFFSCGESGGCDGDEGFVFFEVFLDEGVRRGVTEACDVEGQGVEIVCMEFLDEVCDGSCLS
jgi:hypothetical protein